MHHETELSDLLAQQAIEMALGPTGLFPGGKLTPNDEGSLSFAVTNYNGKVVVNLGAKVTSFGLTATEAKRFARSLLSRAGELDSAQRQNGSRKKGKRRKRGKRR